MVTVAWVQWVQHCQVEQLLVLVGQTNENQPPTLRLTPIAPGLTIQPASDCFVTCRNDSKPNLGADVALINLLSEPCL
jgi:hypothetical protein